MYKRQILASYRGKISQSAADLYAYLKEKDAQLLVVDRLYSYAFQYSDQDTANTTAQAMKNQALGLYTRLFSTIAWESPEILTLTPEILDAWYTEEPSLETVSYTHLDVYKRQIQRLL